MAKGVGELTENVGNKNEEIVGLKMEIAKLGEMESPNVKIRRPLPAELLNELFASLPLEKAFGILAKMPNWLLARNVRKMVKSVKMALKNNKWNAADCGPELTVFDGGLIVKHTGSGAHLKNCVRAVLPFPIFIMTNYFEVEILESSQFWEISIELGFCTQQFPLEGISLGSVENSIVLWHKGGVCIDGHDASFGIAGGTYKVGDVIGLGIHSSGPNSPKKCFATCNGNLLGMVELADKFADLRLFPAVNLYLEGDLILVNFGQNEWRYDTAQIVHE